MKMFGVKKLRTTGYNPRANRKKQTNLLKITWLLMSIILRKSGIYGVARLHMRTTAVCILLLDSHTLNLCLVETIVCC